MTKHEDYMGDVEPICKECVFDKEIGLEYCSKCGKPLSESAEALDYKLKQELPEGF